MIFAQLKQEDVFRSISENVGGNADPMMFYIVGGCVAVFVLVLVIVNAIKKREMSPRAVNHQGKLLKELLKRVPLKKNELKQLKILAAEQNCESPLTLILCPSVLAKGINARGKADRKVTLTIARKMGIIGKKVA